MLELVAEGRGIELLLRIAEQTREGLVSVDASFEAMMSADLRVRNRHPPSAISHLFPDETERERLDLSRAIADKLAHRLYREARSLVDDYKRKYSIVTRLNTEILPGWRLEAEGVLIEDGRRIIAIVDSIATNPDNLIVEEYDIFEHNNYHRATKEIFADAWARINRSLGSLGSEVARLQMFRGLKRGKRTYADG